MLSTGQLADLDLLDHLELFNSTVKVAELLGISQSSCSRRYRCLSDDLELDFDRVDGVYRAGSNRDVLQLLRHASQCLRVRRERLRYCIGMPFAELLPAPGPELGAPLPLCLTDSWRMLSLLDQRMVDVWLGGLLELSGLWSKSSRHLRQAPLELSGSVHAIPLLRWRLQLVAHRDHPLVGRTGLQPTDLAAYPSPALPLGMAPQLMRRLQNHGLANQPVNVPVHQVESWEACSRDSRRLTYSPPHLLPLLARRYQLVPLLYDLGIEEVGALIGHRDVLADTSFPPTLKLLLAGLKSSGPAGHPGLEWLM
jgi:DNA-binding transcriptional LysR family regulator